MASPDQIASALLARCATLSVGSPALPVAMPEIGFDPGVDAPDGKYLEVKAFSNAPFWEGLRSGKIDQGLLQVTVVWPPRQGVIKPKAAAAAVMAHFPKGLKLGAGVKVSKEPWDASPITDDSEVRVPVTISWTAS
jgi:hypothetical protein